MILALTIVTMINEKPTDADLVKDYRKGNQKAFEILLKRYERPLYSFIFRFVHDRESADDLFQQTWFKVVRYLHMYKEEGKFSSWLFGIANNACIDEIRKDKTKQKDDYISEEKLDTLPDCEGDPMEILQKKEKSKWLEKAVEKLPAEQQQVILLRVYADLSFREIAELLQSPLNTILGRMHYATQSLKKMGQLSFNEES